MEKLLFATLEEQRTARRWRAFVGSPWLAVLHLPDLDLTYRGTPSTDKSTPHTAVIEIEARSGPSRKASAEFIVAAAEGAFEDAGAQGVVLLINSPGWQPGAGRHHQRRTERLKAKYKEAAVCRGGGVLRLPPPITSPPSATASSSTRPASSAASAC
jgi:protease-4